MTVAEVITKTSEKFKQAEIPSSRLDAELLLAHALKKTREWLLANNTKQLSASETLRFNQYVSRRLNREPVCYITNQLEFYGLSFYVDNRVLSPRVETELVPEQAIKNAPQGSKLIDIGTGSGAIAVAIAKHRPDLHITATEVSRPALTVAQRNAKKLLGADNGIEFVPADIFDGVDGVFETVVTNLPYVSEDYKPRMKPEVAKEPAIALFGGAGDGLDLYRRFYQQLPKHIKSGSKVYHESDPWQHQELTELAKAAGLKPILEDYLILGFQKS
jgi:release factor glutamine methyltransferase